MDQGIARVHIYTTDKTIGYRTCRYWWQRQAYLTLSAQLLIDLPRGQSLPDKVWWDQTRQALTEIYPKGAFDQGHAKVQGEFFVAGCAYAYDDHTFNSTVAVRVGQNQKVAAVFADRYWLKSGPIYSLAKPAPFKCLPLSMKNALGGAGFAANPTGKGFAVDAHGNWPLANIENPSNLISNPYQRPEPYGFLPSWLSPQQQARLGTFDDKWLAEAWPYLPDDHDPIYWNAAPLDQQITGFWQGDEQIVCTHLHPTKPVVCFELSDHTIRAFYQKKDQAPAEMLMNLDTIWLFPHLEQALLIWHGTIPTLDETAGEIEAVLLAEENRQTGHLSKAHYFALLDAKIHRKAPAKIIKEPQVAKVRKKPLRVDSQAAARKAEREQINQALDADHAQGQQALAETIAKLPADQQTAVKAMIAAAPPVVDLSIPASVRAAAAVDQLSPQMQQAMDDFASKPQAPHNFDAIGAAVAKIKAQPLMAKNPQFSAFIEQSLNDVQHKYVPMLAALSSTSRAPLSSRQKFYQALAKKRIEHRLLEDEHFEGICFESVTFNQVIFKNCHFTDCRFSDCQAKFLSFDHCRLINVCFDHCALTHLGLLTSTLEACQMTTCQVITAFVDHSSIERTLWQGNDFMQSLWQESHWRACQFIGCSEKHGAIKQCHFEQNLWQETTFKQVHYDKCVFTDSEHVDNQWQTVQYYDTRLDRTHMKGGQARGFAFKRCTINNLSLQKMAMPALQILHSSLCGWQVAQSQLPKLQCSQSSLMSMEFSESDLSHARFKLLTQADSISFVQVQLTKAIFQQNHFRELSVERSVFTYSMWQHCYLVHSQWRANDGSFSRFVDCRFDSSFLSNSNYFSASFKRSLFKNTEVSHCNLFRGNFYHAISDNLALKQCMLTDPLPKGFWQRWCEVKSDD